MIFEWLADGYGDLWVRLSDGKEFFEMPGDDAGQTEEVIRERYGIIKRGEIDTMPNMIKDSRGEFWHRNGDTEKMWCECEPDQLLTVAEIIDWYGPVSEVE